MKPLKKNNHVWLGDAGIVNQSIWFIDIRLAKEKYS